MWEKETSKDDQGEKNWIVARIKIGQENILKMVNEGWYE